jgi:hypothetical protein
MGTPLDRRPAGNETVKQLTLPVLASLFAVLAASCGGDNNHTSPPELSALGSLEVTARLEAIGGEFPPNKLYDYAYVMKYRVLKVHRGTCTDEFIYVGHYNPLKPRAEAQDKFSGKLGGNVTTFQVGDVHRMALDGPLDELFMGGIIDKHIKEKGPRYWAFWTERDRE